MTAPEVRCICSRPGASIQCVACYPDLDRRFNAAMDAYITPPAEPGADRGGES